MELGWNIFIFTSGYFLNSACQFIQCILAISVDGLQEEQTPDVEEEFLINMENSNQYCSNMFDYFQHFSVTYYMQHLILIVVILLIFTENMDTWHVKLFVATRLIANWYTLFFFKGKKFLAKIRKNMVLCCTHVFTI